jgi:uncharacterized protein with beta-barrel porin domain
MVLLGAAALAPSGAFAACIPPPPANNVTVTCSGATLAVGTGYGNGLQTGLTINVQAPASVTGTANGISVGDNNTINNLGIVTTAGADVWGINGGASLTVTNSGTIGNLNDLAGINAGGVGLMVTNNATGIINGQSNAILGAGAGGVGTSMVINSGLIQAFGSTIDGGSGFMVVTNNAGGTITTDIGAAVNSTVNSIKVTNSGTISTTVGLSGTAINAGDTATVINLASGVITADGNTITSQNLVLTNFGAVSANGAGASAIFSGNVNITNFGSITALSSAAIFANAGSITNNAGGTISGDSGILANGNISIFNAGSITGSGGTAIGFTVGGGNTLTLGPGSVINGTARGFGADTFQLGGTGADSLDAALFATQYSGYATFNKVGTSTWTLTGTNAAALPWTIFAGTLNVNGTLANATMTVKGGILSGTGTVGSTTFNNGGTFMPGNGTPGTFITVNGNLAFQSGALYLVQLNSATSTLAKVTGTAALAGTVQVTSPATSLRFNSPYTILTSGGLNGTRFNALAMPTAIAGSLIYTSNNVLLNLMSGLGEITGGNVNQRAVGSALDAVFNAAGGPFGPLSAIFNGNVAQNLTQASGELATGSQQTTFDAMNLFLGLLTDPFVAGRGDGATGGAGATPFAEESDGASAYAANGKAPSKSERDAYAAIYRKAPIADSFAQRWSVWAAGYGGSQTTDGNAVLGSNTVTSRIFGTAVGADYRFSPFTLAGFALAGGGTNFSIANGLGTGRSDLFQAGAFVRHTVGPAYISAALAYGWQDVTTDRTVTIAGLDQLRANFNANAFSGRVEGGYRFVVPWMGGVSITPYAAGQFTTFELPAYAEQAIVGANSFALAYGSKSVTDTRSELGVRTDKSFPVQNAILTLRGRFAWAHDFNPDRNIGATFQTLPGASFVVNGAAQAHDAALTTASAEVKWLNGWSAAATFEGEFSDVTRSYAGKGVVRYAW